VKNKTLIIAEAGVNHNGSLKTALELVHKASEAKADIIKFQTFKASLLATADAQTADYQNKNLKTKQTSQLEMLKKLELSYDDHHTIKAECRKLGIGFLSTAFDFQSLDFLVSLDMGLWKIPSGEITNLPYLEKIGRLNQPTIVSTGMCDLNEVEEALKVLQSSGLSKSNLTVLHCNTDYPTQMSDVHLNAMAEMGKYFGIKYGYSDHTLGIEVPIAAVALGATVIEKHFTLSRDLEGPDHKASLEPNELSQMVSAIRNIEQALGRMTKNATDSEIKNRKVARKSIVALNEIKKGQVFTLQNITTSRPGDGISPMKWHDVLGQISQKNYQPGDLI
jgi:N,N'-diacetyllegionaminate synthase